MDKSMGSNKFTEQTIYKKNEPTESQLRMNSTGSYKTLISCLYTSSPEKYGGCTSMIPADLTQCLLQLTSFIKRGISTRTEPPYERQSIFVVYRKKWKKI